MQYWDAMQDKYGFSDGEAIPVGIIAYRTAYILAVNAIAEVKGSKVRACAFDRSGMHNWCLIIFVPLEGKEGWKPLAFAEGKPFEIDVMDDAMAAAIDTARELSIDRFVTCNVRLSKASTKALLGTALEAARTVQEDQ